MNSFIKNKTTAGMVILAAMLMVGHLFFIPLISIADTGDIHHDTANHEPVDGHFSCPTEIHQFVRSEGSIDVTDSPAICSQAYTLRLSLYQNVGTAPYLPSPRSDLPMDRKTVLLI